MSHHNKHERREIEVYPSQQEPQEAIAYRLWEQAGRPEGQDQRFWQEAQAKISQRHQPAGASH